MTISQLAGVTFWNIKPTLLFSDLYEQAGDLKPRHIGIDTAADVFAGQ
jgi:hypothetical protein